MNRGSIIQTLLLWSFHTSWENENKRKKENLGQFQYLGQLGPASSVTVGATTANDTSQSGLVAGWGWSPPVFKATGVCGRLLEYSHSSWVIATKPLNQASAGRVPQHLGRISWPQVLLCVHWNWGWNNRNANRKSINAVWRDSGEMIGRAYYETVIRTGVGRFLI